MRGAPWDWWTVTGSQGPSVKPRALGNRATLTLMRILAEQGVAAESIEAGLDYVEQVGARTVREGYELAMSRVLYTDAELAAGRRFCAGS